VHLTSREINKLHFGILFRSYMQYYPQKRFADLCRFNIVARMLQLRLAQFEINLHLVSNI